MSAREQEYVKSIAVYFDYAATTPIDPKVRSAMMACIEEDGAFGNPSSVSHSYGLAAAELVQSARCQVASLLECHPSEIYFTSGATEANNLAIQGVVAAQSGQTMHIVTTAIEHKSVLDVCANMPCDVTYVEPSSTGLIAPEAVEAALRPNTRLVSVMHVNNETGVKQPIEVIAGMLAARGILLHIDSSQGIGKLPLSLTGIPIDLLSLSAHKMYGPKGVGCLFIRRGKRKQLKPLLFGGGQESGVRPGTVPVHQVVALGKACEIAGERLYDEYLNLENLRSQLITKLARIPGMHLNGELDISIPHIVNCSFDGVDGEALALRLHDVAISVGSACTMGTIERSHVLRAMRLSDSHRIGAVRISMGRFTTAHEINYAAARIADEVAEMRRLNMLV